MKADRVKHLFAGKQEVEWNDWRWQLRRRIRTYEELQEWMGERFFSADISGEGGGPGSFSLRRAFAGTEQLFRFGVTPYYLNLADPSNPHCPILRQILPDESELEDPLFADPDPLKEESHMAVPGLVHRYPDRVLWYLTGSCAVYCRFCTRKRKVSRKEGESRSNREEVLSYLREHREIKEVILSGGDPLVLSEEELERILSPLRSLPHLASIRIHSRVPATLPMRITPSLAELLERFYPLTLVTHFNHPVEVTEDVYRAVKRLRMAGVLVLNQSVLLRGINDTPQTQEELVLSLLRAGIKPYYLHQCDEVKGVSHFRTPLNRGVEILEALRGRNPGVALPRFMVDLPGGGGKIPLEKEYRAGGEKMSDQEKSNRQLFYNWKGEPFSVLL